MPKRGWKVLAVAGALATLAGAVVVASGQRGPETEVQTAGGDGAPAPMDESATSTTTLQSSTTSAPTRSSTTTPTGRRPAPTQVQPGVTTTTKPVLITSPTSSTTTSTTTTTAPAPRVRTRRLVYASAARQDGLGYSYRLLVMNLDTGLVDEVARDVSFLPSWAPDATKVVYTDFQGRIWAHTLATGQRRLLTPEGVRDAKPTFSPDGSLIAFLSDGGSLNAMAADDSNRRELARLGPRGDRPSWSPNGRRIAFSAVMGNGTRIYTIDADGTDLRDVAGGGENPVWSPDGSLIAFAGANNSLWVVRPDGSAARQLSSPAPVYPQFSWSRDSRSLGAIASVPNTATWSLYTFDVQASTYRQISPPGDASTGGVPVWSPDDASLIYLGGCGSKEQTKLCLIDRTSGDLRTIDDYAAGGQPAFAP